MTLSPVKLTLQLSKINEVHGALFGTAVGSVFKFAYQSKSDKRKNNQPKETDK